MWRSPPAAKSDSLAEPLPDGVASALFVNVLTEEYLPYYFASIDSLFGRDGAWGCLEAGDGPPRRGGTRSSCGIT